LEVRKSGKVLEAGQPGRWAWAMEHVFLKTMTTTATTFDMSADINRELVAIGRQL